jgi:hypothetical protein
MKMAGVKRVLPVTGWKIFTFVQIAWQRIVIAVCTTAGGMKPVTGNAIAAEKLWVDCFLMKLPKSSGFKKYEKGVIIF